MRFFSIFDSGAKGKCFTRLGNICATIGVCGILAIPASAADGQLGGGLWVKLSDTQYIWAGPVVSTNGPGYTLWSDPYSNKLAFALRGETNAAGLVVDWRGKYNAKIVSNATSEIVATNVAGRVLYAINYTTNTGAAYMTNGITDVLSGCTAMTVCAWVKPRTLANIFWSAVQCSRAGDYWCLAGYNPQTAWTGRPESDCYGRTTGGITTNQWQMIAVTWSRYLNSGAPQLYLQGTNAPSADTASRTTSLGAMGANMYFGNDVFDLSARRFDGYQTGYRLYTNQYLTAAEMLTLWQNTNPTNSLEVQ